MRACLHFTIAVCLFARIVLCQPQREISPVSPKAQSLFEALQGDADGNTFLMQAAIYATTADLEFLLARGADVNAANKAGHTALMRAMPDLFPKNLTNCGVRRQKMPLLADEYSFYRAVRRQQ
jgi:hypothetical protein